MPISWKDIVALLLGAQLIAGSSLLIASEENTPPPSKTPVVQEQDTTKFLSHDYNELATLPTFTMFAPSGLVPGKGVAFASVSGMTNTPGNGDVDGSIAMGAGWGDPQEGFGGSVSVTVGSVKPDGDFASTGVLNLNMGHFFTDIMFGWSLGVINNDVWHDGREMPDPSVYFSGTKVFDNDRAPVVLNAGFGNNAFTRLKNGGGDRESSAGAFVSAGVYVMPQLSIIVDNTAGVTSTGVSIVPLHDRPVTLNLGAYDVFKYIPGHDSASFTGSVSYAYTY